MTTTTPLADHARQAAASGATGFAPGAAEHLGSVIRRTSPRRWPWRWAPIVERLGVTATTVAYDFAAADTALADLAHGRFAGVAVLTMIDRPT